MSSAPSFNEFQVDRARVRICASREELGRAAAQRAVEVISGAIRRKGQARIIVATGNSQIPSIHALVESAVDWSRVDVFHMDEYIGLSPDHPASFRRWIRERVAEKVHPRNVFYLAADAADLKAEVERYSKLLLAAPIDAAFLGFGENGHIAFNDPPFADFNDPATVKEVVLDAASRRQQVGEGHFPDLSSVPEKALTITCPGLFRAAHWICSVPERRKAEAVRNALTLEISEKCPATLVRRHPDARVFLDRESASLLKQASSFVSH
ncbi:MAG TPA: glucosamine-6-phosphate deaminase [Bryobacteraceae bacterium]|jgi:glucosamine-6-phosphate deaminase|nr:glucosamine-6-phosphate deaminase [Bryobacteraceae bacterium]